MMLNVPRTSGAVSWPDRNTNAPKVTAELVIPERGRLLGWVWMYAWPDGHRTARLGRPDGDGVHVEPLPPTPPGPEFAEAFEAAQRFLEMPAEGLRTSDLDGGSL